MTLLFQRSKPDIRKKQASGKQIIGRNHILNISCIRAFRNPVRRDQCCVHCMMNPGLSGFHFELAPELQFNRMLDPLAFNAFFRPSKMPDIVHGKGCCPAFLFYGLPCSEGCMFCRNPDRKPGDTDPASPGPISPVCDRPDAWGSFRTVRRSSTSPAFCHSTVRE